MCRVFLCAVGALALIACACAQVKVRGETIRDIVEHQIRDHVPASYGEREDQCFSWNDFRRFEEREVPRRIVEALENHPAFEKAMERLLEMPAGERAAYLRRSRLPLRRTWAELGEISPKGTTDAGQRAERAIANAIVDLVERILERRQGEGQAGKA